MHARFTNSKHSLVVGLFLFALVVSWVPSLQASTPIVVEIPEDASKAQEEFTLWENQVKRALEDQDLPIYWAERALHYATWGRDENAIDRARYLLQKLVEHPEPSAAALYYIAKYCYSDPLKIWCDQNFDIEKLKETDQENVAVYFADFPRLGMNEDLEDLKFLNNEESRDRLRQAASATHVDEYFSRDAANWAQLARKVSAQIPPPGQAAEALIEYYGDGIPDNQLHGHHRPIEGVIWRHVHHGWSGSPLNGLPHLCRLMAHLSDKEGVVNCELISDLFLFEWSEPGHPYIGYQIKRALISAVNPGSPELDRLDTLFREEWDVGRGECSRPIWSNNGILPNGGQKALNLYYQDLQDFDYSTANKRAVKREWVDEGLPASGCEDGIDTIILMRAYFPGYERPE